MVVSPRWHSFTDPAFELQKMAKVIEHDGSFFPAAESFPDFFKFASGKNDTHILRKILSGLELA